MVSFPAVSRTLLLALVPALAVATGVLAHRDAARPPATDGDVSYTTWIESQAAGLFDPAIPPLRSLEVSYRVDAHILLPLGFTSIDLWSRREVGTAVASYRDRQAAGDNITRGYELFSASKPERARGLDRMGFFREAVRLTSRGAEWTAYFGAMTSSPEQTYREAVKANDSQADRVFEVTDGFAGPLETSAAVFRVTTTRRVDTANDLYGAVHPQLNVATPRRSSLAGKPPRPLPPSAFIGALQASLRAAAVARGRRPSPSSVRVPFIHNGRVRQLELVGMSADPGRGRQFAASRLARAAGDVYLLRYRIVNPGGDDFPFRLWAELPLTARDDAQAPPIAPLAWETQVRSFLRLDYERIR